MPFSESPECPTCQSQNAIPYNAPIFRAEEGSENIWEWFPQGLGGPYYSLSNGKHHCPFCHQHTLVLTHGLLMRD
jgi:hypothetical protein